MEVDGRPCGTSTGNSILDRSQIDVVRKQGLFFRATYMRWNSKKIGLCVQFCVLALSCTVSDAMAATFVDYDRIFLLHPSEFFQGDPGLLPYGIHPFSGFSVDTFAFESLAITSQPPEICGPGTSPFEQCLVTPAKGGALELVKFGPRITAVGFRLHVSDPLDNIALLVAPDSGPGLVVDSLGSGTYAFHDPLGLNSIAIYSFGHYLPDGTRVFSPFSLDNIITGKLLAPTPEPSTLLLIGAGLFALAPWAAGRRRRCNSASGGESMITEANARSKADIGPREGTSLHGSHG